jgi:ABC-type branched-subunit amino acid transport system ATPase component
MGETSMDQTLLSISEATVTFGGLHALDGASFTVSQGRTTGLIGPNGAGKTTLFNCVSGLLPKSSGRVTFDGIEVMGKRPEQISCAGLVRTFQLARGCPRMTVFEHLMLYGPNQRGEGLIAGVLGGWRLRKEEEELAEQALAVAERLCLDHVLDNLVTALSGGQKKLLEIGRALMARPKMILLDEPMAGVNPTLVSEIATHLEAIREEGITILLIEHEMALIERLCEEVVVMAEGKFLTRGSFREVVSDRRVQESYLGMRRQ